MFAGEEDSDEEGEEERDDVGDVGKGMR